MTINPTVRNILIVAAIAAVVAFVPGGGTTSGVIIQALSLAFLAALSWLALVMYRQHRIDLYALGDRRRAALYVAAGVIVITLSATARMWPTALGSVLWLVLMAGGIYTIFAVVWAARRE